MRWAFPFFSRDFSTQVDMNIFSIAFRNRHSQSFHFCSTSIQHISLPITYHVCRVICKGASFTALPTFISQLVPAD
jgi:hypothetical protein